MDFADKIEIVAAILMLMRGTKLKAEDALLTAGYVLAQIETAKREMAAEVAADKASKLTRPN